MLENPTSQPRVKFGEYPQHFIPGKTKLYVGLISGSKLRDIQSFGTQDPLCEVYIGRSRTPSVKDMEMDQKKVHMSYSPSEVDGESHIESDRYSTSRAESRNSTAIDFDE